MLKVGYRLFHTYEDDRYKDDMCQLDTTLRRKDIAEHVERVLGLKLTSVDRTSLPWVTLDSIYDTFNPSFEASERNESTRYSINQHFGYLEEAEAFYQQVLEAVGPTLVVSVVHTSPRVRPPLRCCPPSASRRRGLVTVVVMTIMVMDHSHPSLRLVFKTYSACTNVTTPPSASSE